MKNYRVVVHFEGGICFDIEAENEEKAAEIADWKFNCISEKEIVEAICDFDVCDVYEEV